MSFLRFRGIDFRDPAIHVSTTIIDLTVSTTFEELRPLFQKHGPIFNCYVLDELVYSEPEPLLLNIIDHGSPTLLNEYLDNYHAALGPSVSDALAHAVSHSDRYRLQCLLEHNADASFSQSTALRFAVANNNFVAMRLLVDFGADITSSDEHHDPTDARLPSALECARIYDRRMIASYLQNIYKIDTAFK